MSVHPLFGTLTAKFIFFLLDFMKGKVSVSINIMFAYGEGIKDH